jgi:hypothetical protein
MTRRKGEVGYREGNTTFGANRRGYRGGRKPTHPPGTELFPLSVRLSDSEYAIAINLGAGNSAAGMRRALTFAAQLLPPGSPQTQAEAMTHARLHRKKNNNVATVEARYKASLSPADLEEWEK